MLALLSLLILAAGVGGAAATKPLDYLTFTPTPLPSTASIAASDELLTWTADSKTLAAGGTAETSLELLLSHRDTLLVGNASLPSDLLRLRLDRDAVRAHKLHQSLTAAAPNKTPKRSFSSAIVSGLAQGSGEYFTRIGVGTPPRYAYMVLDTGSDIVWLQCAPCKKCYSQADPIFDPHRSTSYAAVACGAPLCRRLDTFGCDARRKSCLYQVSYGDGSVTTGEFSTETLTFRRGARIAHVALGCGHDNEGLFIASAGLLGLGRGPLSFPSQSIRRFSRRFSYCLMDRTSAGAGSPAVTKSSSLIFGDAAIPRGAKSAAVSFTPMVRNPRMGTFYYVELAGISVGGSPVSMSAVDLKLDPATGRGGVIVDSGTSVTRLTRPAYTALRDAFKAGAAGLPVSPGGFSLFDTCYDLAGRKEVKVPTVVLHLAGGAQVSLPAENYLIPVDTRGTFCFAFAGTDNGVSIIGNIQQQGFRVIFDGAKNRVGFAPTCTNGDEELVPASATSAVSATSASSEEVRACTSIDNIEGSERLYQRRQHRQRQRR